MLTLEPANLYLSETLNKVWVKPISLDQSFVDFDSVRYHLTTPTRKSLLLLSIDIPCWAELAQYGGRAILQREYGSRLLPDEQTEEGYSASLEIDLEQGPEEGEERSALILALSLLKRNAFASPFERGFRLQAEIEASPVEDGAADPRTEIMTLHNRPSEAIYLLPSSDRVTVIFSTIFKEETDRILGKIFLQEFVDARRRPSCQTAPQVLYSNREPPLEIRHLQGLETMERVGYVTFVLFPRHYTPQNFAATITQIQIFRDYLHMMIKCSKAYLHSRLRLRVKDFGKVLNRAKPEKEEEEKKRVTASGRSFVRS